MLWLRGKQQGELLLLSIVRGSEPDTRAWPKERRHRLHCCSESSAVRSLCRADGPGRGVISRCPKGRVVKATITQSTKKNPNPSPQPVTDVPERPKVIATKKTARPEIPETKATAAPKESTGKPKEKQPRMSKGWLQIRNNQRGCPHTIITSTFEEISVLFDHLPIQACVELTSLLLTSISLPTESASPGLS